MPASTSLRMLLLRGHHVCCCVCRWYLPPQPIDVGSLESRHDKLSVCDVSQVARLFYTEVF